LRYFRIPAEWRERAGLLADDGLQRPLPDLDVALGGNFLGDGEVETGLRFLGIDDGRGADLEIAFR
jgi:hypothetical protein